MDVILRVSFPFQKYFPAFIPTIRRKPLESGFVNIYSNLRVNETDRIGAYMQGMPSHIPQL